MFLQGRDDSNLLLVCNLFYDYMDWIFILTKYPKLRDGFPPARE